jgi:hypothetical protein
MRHTEAASECDHVPSARHSRARTGPRMNCPSTMDHARNGLLDYVEARSRLPFSRRAVAYARQRPRRREYNVGVRIAAMALRIIFIINLILGILFFTGHADNLVLLHMGLGILFVAALWYLGALQALRGGPLGLMLGTFAVGLLLAIVGLVQDGTLWLQIVHVLLVLAAIGLGEMSGARYRKLSGAQIKG